MEYFICPNCGGEVKIKAVACPHCGSDKKTGWSDETDLDGFDFIPNEDDYQDSFNREFGGSEKKDDLKPIIITAIGAVLLLAFIITFIF